jgi:hypothetical protein
MTAGTKRRNYYAMGEWTAYDPPRWKRQPPAPSLRSLPVAAVRAMTANLKPKQTTVETDQ